MPHLLTRWSAFPAAGLLTVHIACAGNTPVQTPMPDLPVATAKDAPARIPAGEFGAGAYRTDQGIQPVVPIHQVQPSYTSQAMRAKIQGVVSMEGVVTANGTVGDVRITKSLDDQLGLDQQAIRAVKQWRFHPARDADGTPVAVVVTFHMEFQLK